jgi:hypothetical protein
MRIATLACWVLTASLGGYMLRTWLAHGGLRRERARAGGLPPQLIFGHMGLALTGLALWTAYTISGSRAVCWAAVGIIIGAIALGICTVTLWTPYPATAPGEPLMGDPRSSHPASPPPSASPSSSVSSASPSSSASPPASGSAPGPHSSFDDDDPRFTVTDEMIAQLLEDPYPPKRERVSGVHFSTLVPVAHGISAIATFVLAVTTVSLT